MGRLALWIVVGALAANAGELEAARDRQDRVALASIAAQRAAEAEKQPQNPDAQYGSAVAASALAEVALELRDRAQAQRAAEAGIKAAERAIALRPGVSEYYRVLGTLCGQVIPANVLAGIGYGKRAQDAISKAIELDPKNPNAYLARGVGNYYLPPAFGGGPDKAAVDFRRTIELDPKSADAWLWLGLALHKSNRNADARQAFAKSLQLNPNRVWAKQQLEKTPAQ